MQQLTDSSKPEGQAIQEEYLNYSIGSFMYQLKNRSNPEDQAIQLEHLGYSSDNFIPCNNKTSSLHQKVKPFSWNTIDIQPAGWWFIDDIIPGYVVTPNYVHHYIMHEVHNNR